MDTWTVTTTATPNQARAATGITEWTPTPDEGSTWTVASVGIATATVRTLRDAGHEAHSAKDIPETAREVLATITALGDHRRARAAADQALKAAKKATDEPAAWAAAHAAGIPVAQIAREAGVDRKFVYRALSS